MCLICKTFKIKYFNIEQINLLPYKIRNAPNITSFIDTLKRNAIIILILPFIGAIAAIIRTIKFASGTTALVELDNSQTLEDERHH